MKPEVMFIQYALAMKYLHQATVVEFFQNHSYPAIPPDIDKIMLKEGLLTDEQVRALHARVETASCEDISDIDEKPQQDAAPSLVLTLSEGKLVEIPLDNETTGEIFAVSPSPASQPVELRNTIANGEFGADSGVVISAEDSREIALQSQQQRGQQETSRYETLDKFNTQQRNLPNANEQRATERYPQSYQMSLQKVHQERDAMLGRAALQKKLITTQLLQECLTERNQMSSQGQYMTLGQILLHKRLIDESQLAELMQECQTSRMDPALADLAGHEMIMDKYRVIQKLGSGGMGIVYKVEHTMLQKNKYFALKVMHPQFASNDTSYKRFVREVELAMGLVHKNIIAIREFGMLPNQVPYLVMDFSPGRPLDDLLKENWNCDIERSLRILRQLLEGLCEAHRHNVIHRDLKPANLLIEQDEQGQDLVKIVDFGLAKLLEDTDGQIESLTQGTVGTPLYMSPEQASGDATDRRSDLYSAGLIAYELILGKRPFHSNSLQKMLIKQMFEEPPAPLQVKPSLPLAVNNLIMKALAKKPLDRYQTAPEFIDDIDKILAGSRHVPKVKSGNSHWLRKAAGCILLLLVLTISFVYFAWPDSYQQGKSWLLAQFEVSKGKVKELLAKEPSEEEKRLARLQEEERLRTMQKQQEAEAYTQAMAKLTALKEQKLWQQAYVTAVEAEKLNIESEQNRQQLAALKQAIAQKLEEVRAFEKTRDMVVSEQQRQAYDKAIQLWQAYLSQYPDNEEKANILSQIEILQTFQQKLALQKEQEKKVAYLESKNKLLAMRAQKLWQEAYVLSLEIEKIPGLDEAEQKEIVAIKQDILQKLEEGRDYQKAKELAQSEREREDYDKAAQVWQGFLQKYPQSEDKANIVSQIESLENARKRQLQQKYDGLINDAKAHMQKQNYAEAVKKLQESLAYQNKNSEALLLLGNAHFAQKEYDKAIRFLTASGDVSATSHFKIARCHASLGHMDEAQEAASKAAARFAEEKNAGDEVVACYLLLAKVQEKKKAPEPAIASYRQAIQHIETYKLSSPEYVKLYAQLGNLLHQHGQQKQDAARYWKTYKNLGGNDAKILSQLLEMTDFTPLAFQKKWEYEIRVGGKQIRKNYEIAAIDKQQCLIRVDGQIGESWYREGDFFIKKVGNNIDKTMKYPVALHSTWNSTPGQQKWEYKIVETGVRVTVPAGVFHDCIKVVARESNNSNQSTFIYYAPDVGVIKEEKLRNNQIIFAKELVAYN